MAGDPVVQLVALSLETKGTKTLSMLSRENSQRRYFFLKDT